jgi:hypothetical protein
MRNLPETPIIFLVYSPKSYFLRFLALLIAISEINYIKQCTDRNYVHKQCIWAQTEAYERHAGLNSSGLDRHEGRYSRLWS